MQFVDLFPEDHEKPQRQLQAIDKLVYELYELSDEEIAIIEASTE